METSRPNQFEIDVRKILEDNKYHVEKTCFKCGKECAGRRHRGCPDIYSKQHDFIIDCKLYGDTRYVGKGDVEKLISDKKIAKVGTAIILTTGKVSDARKQQLENSLCAVIHCTYKNDKFDKNSIKDFIRNLKKILLERSRSRGSNRGRARRTK